MWFRFLVIIPLLSACSWKPAPTSTAAADGATLSRKAWINKASKNLRYGKQVSAAELAAFEGKSQEEIVDLMMADPDFADTLLDFNLYFLGAKQDRLYTVDASGRRSYQYTSVNDGNTFFVNDRFYPAVGSAIATFGDGDFLQLLSPDFSLSFPVNPSTQTSLDQLKLFSAFAADLDADLSANASKESVCTKFKASPVANLSLPSIISQLTQDFQLSPLLNDYQTSPADAASVTSACASPDADLTVTVEAIRAHLAKGLKVAAGIKAPLRTDAMGSILNNGTLDLTFDKSQLYFGNFFWTRYQNSSTNRNRRRAAGVLKTYLCDDLTPINVVQQEGDFGEGAHASNQGCQACHYKLDPMGGFFRHRGQRGTSYETLPSITFDDFTTISGTFKDDYLQPWRAEEGADREWNVGFIRAKIGSGLESKNDYGSTPSDLIRILAKAPEAKRCVVKRMTEYFLGPDQVYDEGWIASLQKKFDTTPSSGVAAKQIIKSLVTSNTFQLRDPDAGVCYDSAPNTTPSKLPCKVSFIITKHCANCHAGPGAEFGLDLTSWTESGSGTGYFAHVRDGVVVAPAETMQLISDRIASDDPEFSMPFNAFMPAVAKAELYRWVQSQLVGQE